MQDYEYISPYESFRTWCRVSSLLFGIFGIHLLVFSFLFDNVRLTIFSSCILLILLVQLSVLLMWRTRSNNNGTNS